ncbi:hypothetical protein AYI68_g2248 [Smittium mucronatum]|uniref:Uncharacterized protein n=1 Tax=Smittium mucronatum TaxID=133383 RepID=A0A1R0H3A8_9FUNG|nr:hypothetical protein AYI68_g2248 [Smittium mucronatum]
MEELVSSLMGLSLNSGPNPPIRFSPVIPTVGAVQTLSVVSTGSNGRSVDRRIVLFFHGFNSAMGMIKRDHELVESGGYSGEFTPEVDA